MSHQEICDALDRHWAAADSGDFTTEHETQHFADAFEAAQWRKKRVHNMDRPQNQGRPK
jgi:hypothetical protein